MKRIKKKSRYPFVGFLGFALRVVKSIIKTINPFFLRAVNYLLTEIVLYSVVLGLTFVFHLLGASNSLAFGLSIVTLILIGILVAIGFFSLFQSKLSKRRTLRTAFNKVRGEEKLADWISQTLAQKAPQEWEEYQDWLHDIFLARIQLLDRGFPVWKVRMITYWRLIGFCLTVTFIKLRRLAIRFRA